MPRIMVIIYPDGIRRELDTRTGCVDEIIRLLGYPKESVVLMHRGEPLLSGMCLDDRAVVEVYVATSGG